MPVKIILKMPPSNPDVDSSGASPSQTTAAAQAFDAVMQEHEQQQQQQQQQPATEGGLTQVDASNDVVMGEGTTPPVRHDSPAIPPSANVETVRTSAASGSHTPSRTPNATLNGTTHLHENLNSSRATSQHPEPAPAPQVSAANFPKTAAAHGAPTRQYLNGKVTTVLLEGMKIIAKDQPKDPLRVLGEYLLQRSKEIEGS